MLTAKTETAKYVNPNHQPKPFEAVLSEFRSNLQNAIPARHFTIEEVANMAGTNANHLKSILLGTKVPSLAIYISLQNWLDSAPLPVALVAKPAPAPKAPDPVAPPPFPQSKALLSWMNLQHALLYMNITTKTALFDQSVEALNKYFSGYDREEVKKTAREEHRHE